MATQYAQYFVHVRNYVDKALMLEWKRVSKETDTNEWCQLNMDKLALLMPEKELDQVPQFAWVKWS